MQEKEGIDIVKKMLPNPKQKERGIGKGAWWNGNMTGSKLVDASSIPAVPIAKVSKRSKEVDSNSIAIDATKVQIFPFALMREYPSQVKRARLKTLYHSGFASSNLASRTKKRRIMTCPNKKCKREEISNVTFSGEDSSCWIIEDKPHPFNSSIWFKIIYCPYCGIKLPEEKC